MFFFQFSIPHTAYFNAKDWASVRRYRKEFVKVEAQLRDVLINSQRIAVLKSGLVMDVALSYGVPICVGLPGNMEKHMEKQMENSSTKALQQ